MQLELLCSLGHGLSGGLESDPVGEGSRVRAPDETRSAELDFALPIAFGFFDMGSNVMIFGLGAGRGAISTDSRRIIRLSQDTVGEMVVGRVKVAVIT
jgi:hypothetical protein